MNVFTYLMLASLVGAGVYLLTSRRYTEALLGLGLLSNGINLLLIESSQELPSHVDPLPQALILTAIVIGFALMAFLCAFALNRVQTNQSEKISECDEEAVS